VAQLVDATQMPTGALCVTDDARVQRSSGGATASEIASLSRLLGNDRLAEPPRFLVAASRCSRTSSRRSTPRSANDRVRTRRAQPR
jgi:hypothetical protein